MKILKKIKKYLIVISTTIMMLLLNFLGIANSVYAAELGTEANLQKVGDCGSLLQYKGITVITTYVAYKDGNNLYPAYCLNANIPGVGEMGSYTVSTNNFVTDVGLWRRVINGYPYKTLSELGCNTKEEAYTATKHAIYCYVQGNNPDNYSAIGEAGERTLNAMKKIISNAESSNETKMETSISINKNDLLFKLDNLDTKYVSKTYEVQSNADFKTYTISMEKVGNNNLPDGIKITNLQNKEQKTFNKGEKFKVLIPINTLKNDGEFKLNIKSEMNTKPVLYGKAPNSGLQDYAITTLKYENGSSSIQDNYTKNSTKIIVFKQEKGTKKPLEGVTFNLLNEKKEAIQAGLKTNKDGKIEINNLLPGKYYLQETATLDGYVRYDEDIEVNVDLNEDFKVTVNNSKEKQIEVEKSEKEVTVGKEAEHTQIQEKQEKTNIQKTVKKLPVTGM
ncbi:MAG: Cys-Gln thioester bond-forming surface protein [Clostridia bacterium]|nr:Cys-Gln thioester bond-forming surface protein [Clostridia bacterium]